MSHVVVDPVYDQITLFNHERVLTEQSFFQRLKHIKQLGPIFYCYPAANHTRFEHCLGTLYVADLIYKTLKNKRNQLDERSREEKVYIEKLVDKLKPNKYRFLVRLVALVHDVGHGPFSHSFEQILERNPRFILKRRDLLRIPEIRAIKAKNRTLWKNYVPKLLERHEDFTIIVLLKYREQIESVISGRIEFEDVLKVLTGKTGDDEVLDVLSKIISGDVDADRIDYLLRDTHHVGFRHSGIELYSIVNQLRLIYLANHKKWLIGASRGGVLPVEALLIARKYHYDRIATDENARKYEQWLVRKLEQALSKLSPDIRRRKLAGFFIGGKDDDVIEFLEKAHGMVFHELMSEASRHDCVFDMKWMQFMPQIRYDLYLIWRIGEKRKEFERYFEKTLKELLNEEFIVDLYFHGKLPTFLTVSAVPGFRFLYDYSVVIGDFPLVIYENGGIRIYRKSAAQGKRPADISEEIERSIFSKPEVNQRVLYKRIFVDALMELTSDLRKGYSFAERKELRRCRDLDFLLSLLFTVYKNLKENKEMLKTICENLVKKYGKENIDEIKRQIERRKATVGIRTSIYTFIFDVRDSFSYWKNLKTISFPGAVSQFYYCEQAYEDLQILRALGLVTEMRLLHNPEVKRNIRWHTPMFYYLIDRSTLSYINERKELQKMCKKIDSKIKDKLPKRLENQIQKMLRL